jgi:hypothetical protein
MRKAVGVGGMKMEKSVLGIFYPFNWLSANIRIQFRGSANKILPVSANTNTGALNWLFGYLHKGPCPQ